MLFRLSLKQWVPLASSAADPQPLASVTTWAGQSVMAAASTSFSLQVESASGGKNQITVTVGSMTTSSLSLKTSPTAAKVSVLTTPSAITILTPQGTGGDNSGITFTVTGGWAT